MPKTSKRFGDLLLHEAGVAQRSTLIAADRRVPCENRAFRLTQQRRLKVHPVNTMASDIYEELFERMKAGRDALADKYPWFTHDTALGQLQGIRKEGLLPHAVSSCPSEVINWFGEPGRQIVCLHPVGAAGSVTKGFLATTLAIAVDRGKFRWDDRVVDLDPEFRLKDHG